MPPALHTSGKAVAFRFRVGKINSGMPWLARRMDDVAGNPAWNRDPANPDSMQGENDAYGIA